MMQTPYEEYEDIKLPRMPLIGTTTLELNELSHYLIGGLGFSQDDAVETALRFRVYLQEYVPESEPDFELTTFEAPKAQLIADFNLEFSSICKHHLLPFFGLAHVGYIPAKRIIGTSKMPRLVDWLAHRPQTQEDLTAQIVSWMYRTLDPQGVMVVLECVHTCMSCRGVRKVGAKMVTSLPKGCFFSSPPARQEFLDLLIMSRKDISR